MKYYVYRHVRLDTNQPFYIGVGTKPREFHTWKVEYSRAHSRNGRSKWWLASTRKIPYEVEILIEVETRAEAFTKEKEFIALYGRRNRATGKLVNLTDGGEGPSECLRKQTISEKMKGTKNRGIKVKDISNGTIYPSVRDAAKAIKLGYSTLRMMLEHNFLNKTSLQYEKQGDNI